MTQRDAVWAACEELGVNTDLKVLQGRASHIYGRCIHVSQCSTYRGQYCVRNKIAKPDCRTYRGQPRRDMRNDEVFTAKQLRLVRGLTNYEHNKIAILVNQGQFHSMSQFVNLLNAMAVKQAA